MGARPPAPGWLRLPLLTWVASVFAGWLLLVAATAHLTVSDLSAAGAPLAMISALVVVLELRPVVAGGGHDPQGVSLSAAFVFAILFVWGLWPALVVMSIATLLIELSRRKPPYKWLFNVGQYNLSLAASWLVLCAADVEPTLTSGRHEISADDLLWILGSWVVYFLVNHVLVSAVLARSWTDLPASLREDAGYYLVTTFAVLALSPLVVIVAQAAWVFLPFLLLPVAMVYRTAAMSLEKEHQAHHDALTGLPNRQLLRQRLAEAVDDATRIGGRCALLVLDLDRFKEVNDTLGHQAGDRLLQELSGRLRAALRERDTVARLGGDEFAIVLPGHRDAAQIEALAQRLQAACAQPVPMDGLLLDVDASIGIALCPDHGSDPEVLMRHADVAMYDAKENRRGVAMYAADRDGNSTDRLGLLGELRRALEEGGTGLSLHYQPKVSVHGSPDAAPVLGVEALVRWHHPERGEMLPAQFIALAERSGLMTRLTQYVVQTALAQAARWHAEGLHVPVAVNVSVQDLTDEALFEALEAGLRHGGLPAGGLQLEVTERLVGEGSAELEDALVRLRRLGVPLSLDDFGTGYSSLVRLRHLQVREIKIDREFVSHLTSGSSDLALVRAVVDLAHALGVPVVAEGVESRGQWALLEQLGCDAAQGWLVARAMPAPEATRWLRARRAARATEAAALPTAALPTAALPTAAGAGS
jgi:diguanylate cyclase (GGDEF)-like protein